MNVLNVSIFYQLTACLLLNFKFYKNYKNKVPILDIFPPIFDVLNLEF